MRNRHPTRPLHFERLEHRAMLAGTVTIHVGGPPAPIFNLSITGDDAANTIIIHQVPTSGLGPVVQIQGINTKLVAVISVEDTSFTETGTSFTFSANNVVIALGGGNDSLTIYNTKFVGTLTVDMGAGNDVLNMSNVQFQGVSFTGINSPAANIAKPQELLLTGSISPGTGNDVAILTNVSSNGNVIINAGDGRDSVVLSHVTAGALGSGNVLSVEMGPGNPDILSVVSCTADQGLFSDIGGANGLLMKSSNHFGSETDTGFSVVT